MFVHKHFTYLTISRVRISKSKMCYNVEHLKDFKYYCHTATSIYWLIHFNVSIPIILKMCFDSFHNLEIK